MAGSSTLRILSVVAAAYAGVSMLHFRPWVRDTQVDGRREALKVGFLPVT